MLSQNQMVKTKSAIRSLYDGRMSIIEHQEYTKDNGATAFKDVEVVTDKPCRVSFSSSQNSERGEAASATSQTIKLFTDTDIEIKAGSKIIVTQYDLTQEYMSSGTPAVHSNHQEVVLELFKRWA